MMLMTPDAWVRGANPWCGWLRFVLLPAALVPLWFGQSMVAMMVVMLWMMLPRLFRKPTSDTAWMTRAQLGVQIWRSRPLGDPRPLLMLCLILLSLMRAANTAVDHRLEATLLYGVAYVVTHLIFLSRTAQLYQSRLDGDAVVDPPQDERPPQDEQRPQDEQPNPDDAT